VFGVAQVPSADIYRRPGKVVELDGVFEWVVGMGEDFVDNDVLQGEEVAVAGRGRGREVNDVGGAIGQASSRHVERGRDIGDVVDEGAIDGGNADRLARGGVVQLEVGVVGSCGNIVIGPESLETIQTRGDERKGWNRRFAWSGKIIGQAQASQGNRLTIGVIDLEPIFARGWVRQPFVDLQQEGIAQSGEIVDGAGRGIHEHEVRGSDDNPNGEVRRLDSIRDGGDQRTTVGEFVEKENGAAGVFDAEAAVGRGSGQVGIATDNEVATRRNNRAWREDETVAECQRYR